MQDVTTVSPNAPPVEPPRLYERVKAHLIAGRGKPFPDIVRQFALLHMDDDVSGTRELFRECAAYAHEHDPGALWLVVPKERVNGRGKATTN